MFIICPKCSAKYKIPEGIQLESGQKLKCSACNFVFSKGEEAPLVLEEATESSTLTSTPELKTTPADSLPEAFQPVDTPPTKQKKGVGIVFLYLIFVIALCVLGWMYRDSLKPSMQAVFPSLTLDEAKIPPKARQNALPVRPKRVEPVNQPTVTVSELPQKEERPNKPPKKRTFQKGKPIKARPGVEKEIPVIAAEPTVPQPIVTPEITAPATETTVPKTTVSLTETTASETTVPETETAIPAPIKPEIILPEPTLDSQPAPILPEPTPEIVPLFEVIEAPLPAATAEDLTVNTISFRIEPTEEGVEQVLIEGQIQNNAQDKKSIPVLTVLAVNKEGQILAQKKVHTAGDDLESGAQIPFYTSLTPAPADLDHIEVQF